MIVTLRTERIRTLDQMRAFVEGNEPADFEFTDRTSAYAVIRRTLVRFEYHTLRKPDKGLVRRFLEKATGFSEAQMDRLIAQHRRTGGIRDHRRKPPAKPFPRRYTTYDAALLAEVDEAFGQLSGPATKVILWRMRHVHGDERFERLAGISNGHIYNLRRTRTYRTGRLTFRETRPTPASFGVRRKPRPHGQPGFLRVDTVHLGDLDGKKGAYVINVVDEVTQFQHLGAVRRITQQFMVPILEALISAFPFTAQAFHADNGSEYVNREVADLLNRLHIPTFTKSRPRRSNDNALVESKNGSIVRRWLGHVHIPHELVPQLDAFLRDSLCPLLNFHRPCLFPTEVTSDSGRVTKTYRQDDVATPYQHFRSLPGAEGLLRPGVTFEALDRIASATTGLNAAKAVQRARDALFRAIGQARDSAA
jgi:hypothetical protein